MSDSPLVDRLREAALAEGFAACGVTDAAVPATLPQFHDWLDAGLHGEMSYLPRRRDAYGDLGAVLPAVRSVVVLAMPYRTAEPATARPGAGRIARYAWSGRDYHDTLRPRLRAVATVLHEEVPGSRTRGVVDTAPVLERDIAQRAGLGWFGKNTLLLSKRPELRGSLFFLAALLTDVPLPADRPHETAHCGTCTACLDICPTDAFPAPHVLDARRCISYLTIELRDRPVPVDLRPGLHDWVFGCDLCQEVCPWNRHAPHGPTEFAPRSDLEPVDLLDLLALTDDTFETRFAGTPLHRTGRAALVRNACYAAANTKLVAAGEPLRVLLSDPSPLVRDAAAWALQQLGENPVSDVAAAPAV